MAVRATAQNNANQTYGQQADTSYTSAQQDLNQASNDQANLRSGKMVGADPYLNPTYLAAVNKLRSGALNQQTNAGDAALRANNVRTGGMNSTATTGAIGKLALDKARLGSQLGAEQTAGDWTKNIGYQLNLAQQPLQAAGLQTGLYSTAQRGQSSALSDLTQAQLAQQQLEAAALTAAGGAAGAAAKACWIAAAVYDGWDDPRTIDVRRWLNEEFTQTFAGKITMAVYLAIGRQVAWAVSRSSLLRKLFRPVFDKALAKARSTGSGGRN
jgi:hypothetical protein